MGALYQNNLKTKLTLTLNAGAAAMTVEVPAAGFPTLGEGDYFLLTLIGKDATGIENAWEVVKVTAVNGGLLTIGERGMEGTPDTSWPIESGVELRLTAGTVQSMAQELADQYSPAQVNALLAAKKDKLAAGEVENAIIDGLACTIDEELIAPDFLWTNGTNITDVNGVLASGLLVSPFPITVEIYEYNTVSKTESNVSAWEIMGATGTGIPGAQVTADLRPLEYHGIDYAAPSGNTEIRMRQRLTNSWLKAFLLANFGSPSDFASATHEHTPPLVTRLTSGGGTWTIAPGCAYFDVECVGAGGAGGGAVSSPSGQHYAGGGGGGGAYAKTRVNNPVQGSSYSYSVGAGGSTSGAFGEFTRLGIDICEAAGGGPGLEANTTSSGVGGNGGTLNNSTGDFILAGEHGGWGKGGAVDNSWGAAGAGSFFSGPTETLRTYSPSNGISGVSPGQGGGGAMSAYSFPFSGGNGADGIIIITEYFA